MLIARNRGDPRSIMSNTQASSSETVLRDLDGLLPDLEALYKDVHSHPELSIQEVRTAGLAADHHLTKAWPSHQWKL
jgi:hypothetical protein